MSLFEIDQQKYVLDANYFIQASRLYYDLGIFPCFWKWTLQNFNKENFILIDKVYQELTGSGDLLNQWVATNLKQWVISTNQPSVRESYTYVLGYTEGLASGKQPRFRRAAIEDFAIVADSWLIAYAKAEKACIVTNEIPSNSSNKVKIPTICDNLKIDHITREDLLKTLHPVFD